MLKKTPLSLWLLGFLFFIFLLSILLVRVFPSGGNDGREKLFIVPPRASKEEVVQKLRKEEFIKFPLIFKPVLRLKEKQDTISPGGYYLSKNMSIWQILNKLTSAPDLKWIVIPEGLRKEEIGEILAKNLGWSDKDLIDWNNIYTKMKFDYIEGVYFPDTYLIPVNEKNSEVYLRMINRFEEKIAPYQEEFLKKNIKWTTGLKLASIVQREAAGKGDMSLIAGILWNRLLKGMKLEIDATVQYAKGRTENGWWAAVKPEDMKIDSPFNTYLYGGLPPHPICNPGLDAIEAVLNPVETDCLYYLHDSDRKIHCAKTFEEHQKNIDIFLK